MNAHGLERPFCPTSVVQCRARGQPGVRSGTSPAELGGQTRGSVSLIDVDRASAGAGRAEVARVLVGTDDPSAQSHPLFPSVTPDGREVVVPNVCANNVSIVLLRCRSTRTRAVSSAWS
jgi:hypothetical protein